MGKNRIETSRLFLREMIEQDIEWFYQLNADPEVMRYTGEKPFSNREQALQVLRDRPIRDYRVYGYGRLACVLKDTDQCIGWCGLKFLDDLNEVDVGYRLLPKFWGRRFATEASQACVNYGFDTLDLGRIIGIALPENIASIRVLEKSGLINQGIISYDGVKVLKYVALKQDFL